MSATTTRRKSAKPSEPTYGGTIKIPYGCKPSKACSPDPVRPIIRHGYLRQRKDGLWLCATDAYIAVALKVDGTATEGWVPRDVLALMERVAKHGKAKLTFEQISKTSWRVASADEAVVTVYDVAKELGYGRSDTELTFPDLEAMCDGLLFTAAELNGNPGAFGFNPKLLARIGEALGGPVRAEVTAPLKPLRLTAIGSEDRVALQMPIRLNI